MSRREMSVAGQFYPAEASELKRYFSLFDEALNGETVPEIEGEVRALIVPHAGYVYSGFTASIAYRYLPKACRRIIVIGPSHRVAYEGVSASLFEHYATPLGDLAIDEAYIAQLQARFDIGFAPAMHREHSTEVQMPFIKSACPEAKVVELVYGRFGHQALSLIIDALLEDRENFVIISTDLSHFYTQSEANRLDRHCLKGVEALDLAKLEHCEACGITGVKAILESARRKGLHAQLLDYRTSGDISGDRGSVVGYMSALFSE